MAHPRKQIRAAVTAALLGETDAGSRVFKARHLPTRRTELPAVLVRSGSGGESVDADSSTTAPRELTCRYDLEVCAVVRVDDEDVDDTLDDMAEQIQTVMETDPFWGDLVVDSIRVNTEAAEVEIDGDRSVGGLVLTYEFTYRYLAPDAPTDLDDFLSVKATHNLGGEVHEDIDAEDEFVVQEVA